MSKLKATFITKPPKNLDKALDDLFAPNIKMNITGTVDVIFMQEIISFIEQYDTTKTTSNAHAHKQRQSRKNPTISNNGMEKKKRGNL